jgi:hypothetical protein
VDSSAQRTQTAVMMMMVTENLGSSINSNVHVHVSISLSASFRFSLDHGSGETNLGNSLTGLITESHMGYTYEEEERK